MLRSLVGSEMCIRDSTQLIDVIKTLFPDLKGLTSEDFRTIRKQTLLLLDGIDEFKDIESIKNTDVKPHVKLIKNDILDPNKAISAYRIVVGRPEICRTFHRLLSGEFRIQFASVEVCGFDNENVDLYIDQFFPNDNRKVEELKNKMELSATLRAMSTVPVYLWAICGIFRQSREIPKTVTELLLYNLLLFLQNHWLSKKEPLISLNDLVNDINVYECIKDVALFAYETLRQRKVVIPMQSNSDNVNKLKDVGIIDQYLDGMTGLTLLEFRHLTIQELLAAIHIMFQTNIQEKEGMLKDHALVSTLGFVSGLEGLLSCSKKLLLNLFLNRLFKEVGDEIRTTFIESTSSKNVLCLNNEAQEYLYEFQTTTPAIISHLKKQCFYFSYEPSTKLYCMDHLIDLLNQNETKFTVKDFTLSSKLIQYGNQRFITQLLCDHTEDTQNLTILLNDEYFHQISTIINEMAGLSWINLSKIQVNVGAGCKHFYRSVLKIAQVAAYAEYIDFSGGISRLHCLLLEVAFYFFLIINSRQYT